MTEPPLDRFVSLVRRGLEDESIVRLVLSSPTPQAAPIRRREGRLVEIRSGRVFAVTTHEPTRDLTTNLGLEDVDPWLRGQLGFAFRAALLETTRRDWQLSVPNAGPARLIAHAPRHREPPARSHDLAKKASFGESARDWLGALDLVDEEGRPRPRRADKFRQVERFAEILGHLVRETDWTAPASLAVADMGCGRGYLTFAAWQLLRRDLGLAADVIGVETRDTLVRDAEALRRRLGLEGIRFVAGTIADLPLEKVDLLVALHACDTATDDALRRGVERGARLILAAPCCHRQVRPQLAVPDPLAPVLEHGIMAERFAEWLTDGLRALFLEWAGYRVKLIEFVASEHTPRNLLLAAVRQSPPFADSSLRDRILALKSYAGGIRHALDPWLEP